MCLSLLPHPVDMAGGGVGVLALKESLPGVQRHCIHHRDPGVTVNSFFRGSCGDVGRKEQRDWDVTERRLLSLRPKQTET